MTHTQRSGTVPPAMANKKDKYPGGKDRIIPKAERHCDIECSHSVACGLDYEEQESAGYCCGHSFGDHCFDKAGNELPDAGPCRKCDCKQFE